MIRINDTYYVSVDPTCYTLYRRFIGVGKYDKQTKELEEILGYYTDLKSAINKALIDAVRRGLAVENRELSEAIVVINEITESFKKSLDEKIKQDV